MFTNIDWIETVQESDDGWIVNDSMHVPNTEENRHCRDVLEWIKQGNKPKPKAMPVDTTEQDQVEILIQEKIREIAIEELKIEGKLNDDGKVMNESR